MLVRNEIVPADKPRCGRHVSVTTNKPTKRWMCHSGRYSVANTSQVLTALPKQHDTVVVPKRNAVTLAAEIPLLQEPSDTTDTANKQARCSDCQL